MMDIWKYLLTVPPSDIIKFDAIEFIPLPNDWSTTTDANIANVRDSGNSDINNNQIKRYTSRWCTYTRWSWW